MSIRLSKLLVSNGCDWRETTADYLAPTHDCLAFQVRVRIPFELFKPDENNVESADDIQFYQLVKS